MNNGVLEGFNLQLVNGKFAFPNLTNIVINLRHYYNIVIYVIALSVKSSCHSHSFNGETIICLVSNQPYVLLKGR